MHLQKASKNMGYKKGDFPEAENQSKDLLTLPVHQYLNKNKLDEDDSMKNCTIVIQVDGRKRGILELPLNSKFSKFSESNNIALSKS